MALLLSLVVVLSSLLAAMFFSPPPFLCTSFLKQLAPPPTKAEAKPRIGLLDGPPSQWTVGVVESPPTANQWVPGGSAGRVAKHGSALHGGEGGSGQGQEPSWPALRSEPPPAATWRRLLLTWRPSWAGPLFCLLAWAALTFLALGMAALPLVRQGRAVRALLGAGRPGGRTVGAATARFPTASDIRAAAIHSSASCLVANHLAASPRGLPLADIWLCVGACLAAHAAAALLAPPRPTERKASGRPHPSTPEDAARSSAGDLSQPPAQSRTRASTDLATSSQHNQGAQPTLRAAPPHRAATDKGTGGAAGCDAGVPSSKEATRVCEPRSPPGDEHLPGGRVCGGRLGGAVGLALFLHATCAVALLVGAIRVALTWRWLLFSP